MTLVTMPDVVTSAVLGGLGAFNVIQLEHAEAIVSGAESARRPVVLQISENTVAYHRSLAPLAVACLRIAAESSADVVVHLDHATDVQLVEQAVGLGVRSIMYDASRMPPGTNVASTAEVTRWCHERAVWVEAELGEVGGKDGVHARGVRTDPAEAAAYVEATQVDALAVAVGSSHAMSTRDAQLDNELIAALATSVGVPLVLHGSSGVPEAGITAAVAHGMVKINMATRLNKVMTAAVREALAADDQLVDPRKYLGPGREAVAAEVSRLLALLGG
ncbi:MAG: class II fructose-bisphosphate aldolase family protein [Propionibacteriales bacterium]|nr:class II fructose-bisphosphate aldolase family protein [Propionibacteriales bacterium]